MELKEIFYILMDQPILLAGKIGFLFSIMPFQLNSFHNSHNIPYLLHSTILIFTQAINHPLSFHFHHSTLHNLFRKKKYHNNLFSGIPLHVDYPYSSVHILIRKFSSPIFRKLNSPPISSFLYILCSICSLGTSGFANCYLLPD